MRICNERQRKKETLMNSVKEQRKRKRREGSNQGGKERYVSERER